MPADGDAPTPRASSAPVATDGSLDLWIGFAWGMATLALLILAFAEFFVAPGFMATYQDFGAMPASARVLLHPATRVVIMASPLIAIALALLGPSAPRRRLTVATVFALLSVAALVLWLVALYAPLLAVAPPIR
jgi:hypothetical protein